MTDVLEININYVKKQAKRLKRETDKTHTECLHIISKDLGYRTWDHLLKTYKHEGIKCQN